MTYHIRILDRGRNAELPHFTLADSSFDDLELAKEFADSFSQGCQATVLSDNILDPDAGLDEIAKTIECFRLTVLFDGDPGAGLCPVSEQYFLAAINALDSAVINLRLADAHQARELAKIRTGART